jgi:hypothetical protein
MKRSPSALLLCVAFACLCHFSALSQAGELALNVVKKEPPGAVDESIRKTLQPTAIQLLDGDKAAFEFWLSSEIALQSKPASPTAAMDSLKQSALLGVVAVASDTRDYKDVELFAGVYTMRFALQPQDGNHLGTAEFNYFAVLVPSKKDVKPDGITDYKALVRASRAGTPSDHPVILSLRPVSSIEGETPKLNEPAPDHKSVILKIPARVEGGEPGALLLELVYQGKGKV